jgi:hypothetical protein
MNIVDPEIRQRDATIRELEAKIGELEFELNTCQRLKAGKITQIKCMKSELKNG